MGRCIRRSVLDEAFAWLPDPIAEALAKVPPLPPPAAAVAPPPAPPPPIHCLSCSGVFVCLALCVLFDCFVTPSSLVVLRGTVYFVFPLLVFFFCDPRPPFLVTPVGRIFFFLVASLVFFFLPLTMGYCMYIYFFDVLWRWTIYDTWYMI